MTTFTTISDALLKASGEVSLHGWAYRERGNANLKFVVMRDGTNIIQCVISKNDVDAKSWEDAQKISIESAFEVTGTLKKDERAPTGFELQVKKLKLVHQAERFPITKDQSTEYLLDMRHLWIRSRELTATWKVKAEIMRACRLFFEKKKFTETTPPIITGSNCEGGSTVFEIDYFGDKAYLGQSAQLYLEALIFSLGNVWALTPSFRAEPSKTARHLAEYWHMEMESAWMEFDGLVKFIEEMIVFYCQHVATHCAEELKILGRDPNDLLKIKGPLPTMTYTEAIALLKKRGMDVEWGKDLRTVEEEELVKGLDKPLIVTRYPKSFKAFYMKGDPKDDRVVLCCDVLAPEGYGEIFGASERETDIDVLNTKLKAQGENPDHYQWYLDLRKFGSVPHSGFGMGVERIVRWFCKSETVRDAIPFPRTIKRMTP